MTRREKVAALRRRRWFTLWDALVLAAALLLTAACTAVAFAIPQEKGDSFSVYFRDEKLLTASLAEDADYLFWVEGDTAHIAADAGEARENYNRIRVRGGKVCVESADCPDESCVWMGERDSGTILCLPHALRIEVEGGGLETDV